MDQRVSLWNQMTYAFWTCGGSQPPLSAAMATGRLNIQPDVRERFARIPCFGSCRRLTALDDFRNWLQLGLGARERA
jgi:hypothetical protein